MRLKSFYAPTMRDAMQMVRDTLGEDAVIVATREERGGKAVRVTAAIEQPDDDTHFEDQNRSDHQDMQLLTEEEAWATGRDTEPDNEEAVIEQMTDAILRHAVPEDITDQILSCATVIGADRADESLIAALEHLFSFKPLMNKNPGKVYMFVGPPGAGKTLATAKLAAKNILASRNVKVITTDTLRAGGFEQLSSLTTIMRLNLQKADTPQALAGQLNDIRDYDVTLIDSAGINPFDPEEMRDLAKFISCGPIEPILVLPAGTDPAESGEIARVYAALGVHALMPTRLDIARRIGGLLSAAHYGGLHFADASHTAKVADGLLGLTPRSLAKLLMPEAFKGPAGSQGGQSSTTGQGRQSKAKANAG